jgi:hypothetical protein
MPSTDKKSWPVPPIDYDAFPIARPMRRSDMMSRDSRHWTVCQILREIYRTTDNPEIKLKCRIAHRMTKTMVDKICEYEPDWGKWRWPWREKV